MRWPFISRETYDAACREAERWREIAQERANRVLDIEQVVDKLELRAVRAEGSRDGTEQMVARLRDQNLTLNARILRAESLLEKAEGLALAEEAREHTAREMYLRAEESRALAEAKLEQSVTAAKELKEIAFTTETRALLAEQRANLAERAHGDAEAQVRQWTSMCAVTTNRFDDLLDKFTALRLAGATAPDAKAEPAPRAEPDPVTQAMIAKAHGSAILMKQFREYVNTRRAEGAIEEEIAAEIYAGVSDMEGVPG